MPLPLDIAAVTPRRRFRPTARSGCVLWLSDDSRFVALAQPTVASPTDLSSGSWTRTGLASVTHGAADSDGGTSADTLVENTAAGIHTLRQTVGAYVTTLNAVVTVDFKYTNCPWVWLQMGSARSVFFNVQTGAVGTALGATGSVVLLPNGFYRCTMTTTTPPATAACDIGMANGDNVASYTGTSRSVIAYHARCTQDRVAQWSDRSTAGNHVVQATVANQPRWIQSALNGRPGLLFDGTNDSLKRAALTATLNQPYTVSIVLDDDYSGSAQKMAFDGLDPTHRAAIFHQTDDTSIWTYAGASLQSVTGGMQTPTIVTAVFNGASSIIERNGAAGASGNAGTQTGITALRIGCDVTDAAAFWLGSIYEVIVHNRVLDATERSRMAQYLGGKWGIAVTP